MMKKNAVWHTAQPLWDESLKDRVLDRFHAPALLRFKGDDFMQQLERALSTRPGTLSRLVARWESWRKEQVGWLSEADAVGEQPPKLFQPAHYRFYLIAASLVDQVPGLPQRCVSAAEGERVSFVVRRLMSKSSETFDPRNDKTYDEYGWFGTQQQGDWLPVPAGKRVVASEERIPMFPTTFRFETQRRQLLAGLIPVARRDVYEAGVARTAAPASAAQLQADPASSRAAAEATEHVIAGFAFLTDPDRLKPPVQSTETDERALRLQAKAAFAQALLELAEFVEGKIVHVWNALKNQRSGGLTGAASSLYAHLNSSAPGTPRSWYEILAEVSTPSARGRIDEGDIGESFVDGLLGVSVSRPTLSAMALHLVAGTRLGDMLRGALPDPRPETFDGWVGSSMAELTQPGLGDREAQDALMMVLLALNDFLRAELPAVSEAVEGAAPGSLREADRVVYDLLEEAQIGSTSWRALASDTEAHRMEILGGQVTPRISVVGQRLTAAQIAQGAELAVSLANAVNAALATRPLPDRETARGALVDNPPPVAPARAHYVIRCLYERPECAGFEEAVVSEPSAPFQLASYFDPDAPIRPIRIQMPDVSLKALRRGPRGVAIALSKELREQIARVRGIGLADLDEGKLGPPHSFDFGVICTLSLPIITICALILLMIIVQLLNILFWWLPYFILCLPKIGRSQ